MYAPLYILTYSHGGRCFAFAFNAFSGKHYGQRPYGAGALLGDGQLYMESIFGISDERVALVHSSALAQQDSCTSYAPHTHYVVFPPSDSYVVASATGFVTLRNAGREPLHLTSQARRSELVGGAC